MPDLNTRDFHRDQFLTNLMVGYRPNGFIADQIFPVITVDKQSNAYPVVTQADWFRIPNTLRAPATPAREVKFSVSSDTYLAENYELGAVVPWETIDNADPPWRPMQLQTQQIADLLALDFEDRVATLMATSAGSSQARIGGDAWSDGINSDPLNDIDTGAEAIRQGTGVTQNTLIMGYKVWLELKRHPSLVRAAFPGGAGGGTITEQQFAQMAGVDRILVGRAIKNTAADDTAGTANYTDVWSTHVYLAHIAPTPGIMVPTVGVAFRWGGPNIGNGSPMNPAVLRRSNSKIKAEEIQYGYYQDEKIVAPNLLFQIRTGIT